MSEAVTQRDELPGFSVLVPYFNEAEFIEATLDSLCKQSFFPTELILVDNASTDQSTATAKSFLENHRNDQVECRFLQEAVPGKAHAMNRGLMEATSEWLVICDADTFYPPDYLARAASMICTAKATPVALLAVGISGNEDQRRTRFKRYKTNQMGKLLPRQAHSGGFGHILHIPTLKAVGGFVSTRWPFVLEDHEIIHRMLKRGRTAYDPKLWCRPSDRRNDRSSVEWTRLEQLGYHLCPFDQKDWYFYHFLANRFAKRGLYSDALRRKTWEKQKNSDAD